MARAVVLGAGVAGLLAARVLADHCDTVTVVDRDEPRGDLPRRGVPQGRHAHVLLFRGQAALDDLLPGLADSLVDAGAVVADPGADHHVSFGGHLLRQQPTGDRAVQVTHPFLEARVRDRVCALPRVELRPGHDAVEVVADGGRVTGVRVARRCAGGRVTVLPADVVVDATGTASRTSRQAAVPRHEVGIDVRYASLPLRLEPGALPETAVVVGPRAGAARGMVLLAVERGQWLLTVAGVGAGERPPTDPAGVLAFAATVAPPQVAAAVRRAEPAGCVAVHRFPADVRHGYERVRTLPAGHLVAGDALCRTNPLYGQGLTVAALQALALRDCLARGHEDLARRYFRAAARALAGPWRMAVTADLALVGTRGGGGPLAWSSNAYLARVQAAAARDAGVARRLSRVVGLLDPPAALLHPVVVRAALRRSPATFG